MKRVAVLLIFMVLISGCATGYHQQGFTGGYTDMKLQDDIYKVGFRGNGYCRRERADNLALLRCAEVTLNNGYQYFIIIDEKSLTQASAYTAPVTANTHGTVNTYGNQAIYSGTTLYSGGQTYIYHKPSTTNTIKCFKDKPENIPVIVYDADQIRNNIKAQYHIK
ncbi:MAG: hypothetical protein WDL87_07685 [Candidatus Omnitrophota bacterium]|jgi:hypothetical protein